jgi:hypothetical protein
MSDKKFTSNELKDLFWATANEAITAGLITQKQADTLCTAKKSKAHYWGRHLRNLIEWIEEQKAINDARSDDRHPEKTEAGYTDE